MKLRVVTARKETLVLCPNGSILKADKKVLERLLTEFKKPHSFKGDYGYWNKENPSMEDVFGDTVAFVDDSYKLIIISDKLFSQQKEVVYISATEYAELHGKSRPSIKNMCADGRIPGAYKTSSGWLIPKNAPYPARKPREVKKT